MSRLSRALVAGGAALAVAAGLIACSSGSTPDEERSISIGLPGYQLPVAWDPAGGGFGLYFMSARPVYESLVYYDGATEEYVPWLASEYELSEDGRTLSFTLREDVDFTDGEHMDAEGVVKVIEAAMTRDGSYFNRPEFNEGTSAEVTGEYTFEVRVAEPLYETSVIFREMLLYLPISSPAVIDDPSLVEDGPVGSGPYVLDEFVPEVSATYVRNPGYRDPGAFDFDTIVLKVYDDKVAALNALATGQLDAAEMEPALAAEAESKGLVVQTGLRGPLAVTFLDMTGGESGIGPTDWPELSDKRVRQALNLAIDQAAIAEELELGYARVSSEPHDPSSGLYIDGGDDRYAYDPQAATALLAEAGYAEGFTLKLGTFVGDANRTKYGPVLEQSLADVGVTIEWVEYADDSSMNAALASHEFMGLFALQRYDNMSRYVAEWIVGHSDQVDDEKIAGAGEDFLSGTPAERAEAEPILGEYVLDEAFQVMITHPLQVWVTTPGIEMQLNPVNFFVTLDSFHATD
jgi:peptide/nickel transport system substrate-binding protein